MHGYDTLQGAWNESDRDWTKTPWQSTTRTAGGKTTYKLNLEHIQFTRTEAVDPSTGVILQLSTKFQCSLPKVLYGNNIRTLPFSDVPAALDKLHKLMCDTFPSSPHPSLTTPRRIDATDNRELADEYFVGAALKKLLMYKIGRTKPYMGQDGNVAWPGSGGGHSRKVYSKFRQELQEEARGILRVESGAIGVKSIRGDFEKGLAASIAGGWQPQSEYLEGSLTLGQVLACPGLPAAILGPLATTVDAVLLEASDMKVPEVLKKFVDAGFSYPNAVGKLGYAHAIQEVGWDGLMLTRQGIAKVRKEFAAAGVNPLEVEWAPKAAWITKPYTSSAGAQKRLAKKQDREDLADSEGLPAPAPAKAVGG